VGVWEAVIPTIHGTYLRGLSITLSSRILVEVLIVVGQAL
jgi:hypothetical protein